MSSQGLVSENESTDEGKVTGGSDETVAGEKWRAKVKSKSEARSEVKSHLVRDHPRRRLQDLLAGLIQRLKET